MLEISFPLLHRLDVWTLRVVGGEANAALGRARRPSVVVRLPACDFVRLLAGAAPPRAEGARERTEARGNLLLASRLEQMLRA